ncbi:hypothetical protein [Amycolatopsis tolypomycina]|uniref:Uncharacterized protein n=1 Tax=Amycolatopsis tolypomycina TaxID=208445 RepID=A0A1H4T2Q0_9PSEU|nr:hypothetical protein [Amycolatopsis tolypomycina]SEC50755.1 hypothetical protein SAMN04489727_4007 [Amycolatopsis tolypomycina]
MNRIEETVRTLGADLGLEPLDATVVHTPVLCATLVDAAVGAGAFAARATRHAIVETPGRRAFATFDQGVLHNPRHEVNTASLHGLTDALPCGSLLGIANG